MAHDDSSCDGISSTSPPSPPQEDQEGRNANKIYLGFDFSTQQIKAIAISDSLEVLCEESVQFDNDLPEYRTHGGVLISGVGGNRAVSPTIMWVKALDMLMEKLRIAGVDFSEVIGLSGCGQSHGSVYWRVGARETLRNLSPDKFLHDQLAHAFSVLDSPVWMDSSTSAYCERLEDKVGGPETLANITGSRAYERFTSHQIAKICAEKNEAYVNTERISLVSSFACSLFLGEYAPIDWSDAGGMNLLDFKQKDWSHVCLEATAPDLYSKLSFVVPSSSLLGPVSEYIVERYGFSPSCQVTAFTGDNQSALAGMHLGPGDIGISLGTSDTLFVWLSGGSEEEEGQDYPRAQLSGHIWANPVDKNEYMALICYKNGSLTRERRCNEIADGSWDLFNQLLDSTPRGNFGNIGMYYDHPEITPHGAQGEYRFNKSGECVSRFASQEAEVRALIEGQFMAKRIHAEEMGFRLNKESRIVVCGGASANQAILQVISDIFNAPIYTREKVASNSAALGSALRSRHSILGGEEVVKFGDSVKLAEKDFHLVCSPHKDASAVYKPLMERYRALEQRILTGK